MTDFTLLHIQEIPFQMNLDVPNITNEIKKRIQIAFLFILQYQKGNEASALHAVVRFTLDGKVILEGGATLIFKSKTWDEISHTEETVKQSAFARNIIAYALPLISGIQLARIKDTKLEGMFLPNIDPANLVKDLHVEEIKS